MLERMLIVANSKGIALPATFSASTFTSLPTAVDAAASTFYSGGGAWAPLGVVDTLQHDLSVLSPGAAVLFGAGDEFVDIELGPQPFTLVADKQTPNEKQNPHESGVSESTLKMLMMGFADVQAGRVQQLDLAQVLPTVDGDE